MSFKKLGLLTALSMLALSGVSHAGYKVYAPKVEKGETAVEAQLSGSADDRHSKDGTIKQIYGVEYGVNDWWMTELGVEIEKEHTGESHRLEAFKWENIFVPWKAGENFMDVGFYAELEKAAHGDDPNKGEFKLLLAKDLGQFATVANIGVDREFGPNHSNDWESGAALHARYLLNKHFQPGLEYFAEFGAVDDSKSFDDQKHSFGPVVYGKVSHFKYDAGVLFGVSEYAPDAVAKLNFEYEF